MRMRRSLVKTADVAVNALALRRLRLPAPGQSGVPKPRDDQAERRSALEYSNAIDCGQLRQAATDR
jgi:hypothetical protein